MIVLCRGLWWQNFTVSAIYFLFAALCKMEIGFYSNIFLKRQLRDRESILYV